jgi:hypothetical protein
VSRTAPFKGGNPPGHAVSAFIAQTLTVLIATAMARWSTTLRFTVICLALSLPFVAAVALYLLIR